MRKPSLKSRTLAALRKSKALLAHTSTPEGCEACKLVYVHDRAFGFDAER